MTIHLMVHPHFSFIFSETVLPTYCLFGEYRFYRCGLPEGEVRRLRFHGIWPHLLRELILINSRNYSLTKSNLFSAWLKVSCSTEPKLGVYMRMTGGELTQLRWMH